MVYTKGIYVRKRGSKTYHKVTQLAKDVRMLKRDNETKHTDDLQANIALDFNTNNTRVLCDPNQGLTNQTRIGSQISPYKVEINGRLDSNVATGSAHLVRVMLVQSKQKFIPSTIASAGSPQSVLTLANTENAPISFFDRNTRDKFIVKYDKTFTFDQDDPYKLYKIRAKVSRNIVFEDTGSLVAESGQLYLLHFCDTNASNPRVSYATRVFYKDS